MTIGPAPMCMFCRHLREGRHFTCDAFPDGIPVEILDNKVDHRKPYLGDNGIRFEIKESLPAWIRDGFFDRFKIIFG